jgi:heme exporter protein B
MTSDSLTRAFTLLLKRDLVLAVRHRAEMLNPLLFFVLVTSLFPLGIGAYPKLLQAIGPGVIWVAALLAALLSLDSIFRSDFEDGTLEQFLLSSHPVSILVLILLGLPTEAIGTLLLTLLLGTPVLSLLGAVGVALTVGLRKGGMILSLLVLPLYVPLLIFAANAVDTAAAGLPVTAHISFISALLVLALSLSPLATAAALRISLS